MNAKQEVLQHYKIIFAPGDYCMRVGATDEVDAIEQAQEIMCAFGEDLEDHQVMQVVKCNPRPKAVNDIFMREDYEIAGMYRVETYEFLMGYWTTSDLMTSEQAEEMIKNYTTLRGYT